MQLLFSFSLGVALVASVAAITSYKDSCGADSTVLNTTTILHGGKEVTITTTHCPGFAALARNSSVPSLERQKRQLTQCDSDCTIECGNLGEQPFVGDCQTLTDALESLYRIVFSSERWGQCDAFKGPLSRFGLLNFVTW